MATTTEQNGETTVASGDVAVTIRQNDRAGKEWHCFARIGADFHGAFAGKTYKTEATASRAAVKWVDAKAAQRAEEEAAYARYQATAEPVTTPAWLENVYEQWEAGDVAEVTGKG